MNPSADPHYALVTGVSSRTVYELHELTYTDAQGNTETLQTTANHEFFAINPAGEARWTPAEQLKIGDHLLLPDASVATVTANTEVLVPEGIEVYNLSVADGATYFVDDGQGHASAVWVHNCKIRLWKQYEDRVISQFKQSALRTRNYIGVLNGAKFQGQADLVVNIKGTRQAIEAKYISKWSSSIYNPKSKVGQLDFAKDAQNTIVQQAQKYSNNFIKTTYYTNSEEFAKYYRAAFVSKGIANISIKVFV